jgi:hypothetical protein
MGIESIKWIHLTQYKEHLLTRKDVNTEAEECTALEAVTRRQPV